MKLRKKFEVVPQVTMVVSILSHGHPWLDDDFGGPPWLGNPPLIDINPWLRVQLDLQPFRNLLDEGHILPWRSAHGFFGICWLRKSSDITIKSSKMVFFLQLFIAIPLGTNIWNKYGKMWKSSPAPGLGQVAPALAPPSFRFEAPAKLQDLVSRGWMSSCFIIKSA